jgi:hypothetical protein
MPEIPYESGAYYIFDRGYNDFGNLFRIHQIETNFVFEGQTQPQCEGSFMETTTASGTGRKSIGEQVGMT